MKILVEVTSSEHPNHRRLLRFRGSTGAHPLRWGRVDPCRSVSSLLEWSIHLFVEANAHACGVMLVKQWGVLLCTCTHWLSWFGAGFRILSENRMGVRSFNRAIGPPFPVRPDSDERFPESSSGRGRMDVLTYIRNTFKTTFRRTHHMEMVQPPVGGGCHGLHRDMFIHCPLPC